MSAVPTLKVGGLETSNNPFSSTREGGLLVARNIVINADNTAEPRPGQATGSFGGSSISSSGAVFGSSLYVFDGDLWVGGASVGTFTPADDSLLRMKFAEAKRKLYFNTSTGVKVIAEGGEPTNYNLPAPVVDSEGEQDQLWLSGDSFPVDNQLAFRLTYVYKDPSGIEHESEPSHRFVLVNDQNNSYPIITWFTENNWSQPSFPSSDIVVRFYSTPLSGSDDLDPGDEMFLVHEMPLSEVVVSGTVYVKSLRAVDLETLSSKPLYTNSRTGFGIGQANMRPPLARDIAWSGGRLWYANTTGLHRIFLELVGVGSPDGLQNGDTVTVAGTTYTATTGAPAAGEFSLHTSGTPSENIRLTAKSLSSRLNVSAAVKTLYVSGPNDSPGLLVLEAPTVDHDEFTFYASRETCWNPENSSTSQITSTADRKPNGLYYSRPDQPEAVPLLNYLLIGSENHEIKRILPLRDKLYVFKDDGIYTVSGDEPFRVDLLDNTARLIAPDSAVVLNNQIFCLTTQGVCTVSDTGVRIISRAIESDLKRYLTPANQTAYARTIFAVASEPDRQYQLWLPSSDASYCDIAFVYNTVTQAWVRWDGLQRTWGAVSANDGIYYGTNSAGTYASQRRNGNSDDYRDGSYSVTASGFSNGVADDTFTVTSATAPQVGDVMYAPVASEGAEPISVRISAVTDNGGGSYALTTDTPVYLFSYTTPTCYQAFESELRWNPFHYGAPGMLKSFSKVHYHFSDANFALGKCVFSSNWSPDDETVEISTESVSGFGEGAWGSSQWGQSGGRHFESAFFVPGEKQKGTMLTVGFKCREANSGWKLHGVTIDGDGISDRSTV